MSDAVRRVRVLRPGSLAPWLEQGLRRLEADDIVRRIWTRDWTVWKPQDREITDRLGWLDLPEAAEKDLEGFGDFSASLRGEGLSRAVVLGMGGSSLAPEVFSRLFRTGEGALEIEVLDTTEPTAVAAAARRFDAARTLFVVSSKSGTTAEVAALFAYFYDWSKRANGEAGAAARFVAVTDPGTPLETLARSLGFRKIFPGRPDVGGRFSALTAFGLLPAALKGVDLKRLLAAAGAASAACRIRSPRDNPAALLGTILGTAAVNGLDKLTFLVPPRLFPLAGWLEQLLAESTGKEGRGIVPVVEGSGGLAADRGKDRLFVRFADPNGPGLDEGRAGTPLVELSWENEYSLGAHFFLWEFATAVACHIMGINPFDQPDVESTKKRTREVLGAPGGAAAAMPPAEDVLAGGLADSVPQGTPRPGEALAGFLAGASEGDYFAILAFLPESEAVRERIEAIAGGLRRKRGLPVTVGFGPRYLHSTGQLHKGDGNRGRFLLLAETSMPDVPIPAVPGLARPAPTFAGLFRAQAQGDLLALRDKGRTVLRIDLEGPVEDGLKRIQALLA